MHFLLLLPKTGNFYLDIDYVDNLNITTESFIWISTFLILCILRPYRSILYRF